jgi:hypothetical protein
MKLLVFVSAVAMACAMAAAQPVVLYDATLGTRLDQQGWSYLALDPLLGPVGTTNTYAGGATVLDSTPDASEYAGFGIQPPGSPVLDRMAGFTLQFTLRVESESHSSTDRAGFSILVVTSDLKAIELGFWADEIWAQDDAPTLFVHDEGVAFDTTAAMTQYNLQIAGGNYALSIVGDPATLTGAMRDYTAWDPPLPLLPDPYETPGMIFLGDDTSSAAAKTHISGVVYVPEPATMGLLSLAATSGLAGMILRHRRRRRQ